MVPACQGHVFGMFENTENMANCLLLFMKEMHCDCTRLEGVFESQATECHVHVRRMHNFLVLQVRTYLCVYMYIGWLVLQQCLLCSQ